MAAGSQAPVPPTAPAGSARASCTVPCRAGDTWGVLTAEVVDLRRTGLRLRIPFASLGVSPPAGLLGLSEAVGRLLGEACFAEIRSDDAEGTRSRRIRYWNPGGIQRIADDVLIEASFDDPLAPAPPSKPASPPTSTRRYRRRRATERAVVVTGARLNGAKRSVEATTQDLSRTGVRVRVTLESLGLPRDAGLFDVARALHEQMGTGPTIEVRSPRTRMSRRKRLVLVRIGSVQAPQAEVDLGYRFETPLTDDDLRFLDLPVPPPPAEPASPA